MQEDAEQDFMACKQAYEVLTDAERRRDYDAMALRRRIGFFRDVVEEEESDRADPWEIHRWVQEVEKEFSWLSESGARMIGRHGFIKHFLLVKVMRCCF